MHSDIRCGDTASLELSGVQGRAQCGGCESQRDMRLCRVTQGAGTQPCRSSVRQSTCRSAIAVPRGRECGDTQL